MIDDGGSPDRSSENPEVVWADEQLLIPDDLFGAPSELVGDGPATGPSSSEMPPAVDIWGQTGAVEGTAPPEPAAEEAHSDDLRGPPADLVAEGPAFAGPSDEPFAVPDEVWGEPPSVPGMIEPVAAEIQPEENWWLPREEAADPTLVVPSQPRRPKLAPLPVPVARGRWRGGLDVKKGVAAMALIVVAAVVLIVTMVSRASEQTPSSAAQQIDAAGIRPTSTVPTTTVPRPSRSVTTAVTQEQPAPPTSDVPATPTSPPSSSETTPVITAAPRSPVRTAAPVTAAPAPPERAPAPTPTPAATVPPEPPALVVLPDPEPEPTVTTRRPRPTIPPTTIAPSTTTVPTSESPVVKDD